LDSQRQNKPRYFNISNATYRQTIQTNNKMLEQTPSIGEPTLNSQTLEYKQEQDKLLEQKQTINTTRQRTNYTQEYNQNNEVYIYNILNP
jgi:small-conductance mechanosensitive channel